MPAKFSCYTVHSHHRIQFRLNKTRWACTILWIFTRDMQLSSEKNLDKWSTKNFFRWTKWPGQMWNLSTVLCTRTMRHRGFIHLMKCLWMSDQHLIFLDICRCIVGKLWQSYKSVHYYFVACSLREYTIWVFSHTALTDLQHQIKQLQNKTDREMAALENTITDSKNTIAQRHTALSH